MVGLVSVFEPPENINGIEDAGLANVNLLKSSLKGSVFLHVLAIFSESGSADTSELTPG